MTARTTTNPRKTVRCAVYCRKSTEEGLGQEFSSLDAQREAGTAFIASQRNEGWVHLPERYEDGGYTGANTDRPALKRLMADIDAGLVDCVVVYKVDRLSRSLADFARLIDAFDRRGVTFVSVTQQFNTTHSMGRLTLNILLSFAQFEREVISERTRDKIAASRRRGLYVLGKPLLGYDLVPAPAPYTGRRMAVNPGEAAMVRAVFDMYLQMRSLLGVAAECNARGWTTKSWTTTGGRKVGGRPFDKTIVSRMLRCPLYAGLVPYKREVHPGEHEAVVTRDVFDRVQATLKLNAAEGGTLARPTGSALLAGLVRCGSCGCAMTATSASKRRAGGGRVEYRYYVCSRAGKLGRSTCPRPSLPGRDLEAFVVGQVRTLLTDDGTIAAVVERARAMMAEGAEARLAERDRVASRLGAASAAPESPERRREVERLRRELQALERQVESDRTRLVDEDEMLGAAEGFDAVWAALTPAEQRELLRGLVAGVEYNAADDSVTVTFRDGPPDDDATAPVAAGVAA